MHSYNEISSKNKKLTLNKSVLLIKFYIIIQQPLKADILV